MNAVHGSPQMPDGRGAPLAIAPANLLPRPSAPTGVRDKRKAQAKGGEVGSAQDKDNMTRRLVLIIGCSRTCELRPLGGLLALLRSMVPDASTVESTADALRKARLARWSRDSTEPLAEGPPSSVRNSESLPPGRHSASLLAPGEPLRLMDAILPWLLRLAASSR